MYGQQDLELLIRQRQKEALREAHTRRLAKQARSDGLQPRGLRHIGLASGSIKRPAPVALVSVLLAPLAALLGTNGCSDGTPATNGAWRRSPEPGHSFRPGRDRFPRQIPNRNDAARGRALFLLTRRKKGVKTP